PADGRVVLLRRPRVAGGALDAVADQADPRRNAAAPYGQPRQVDVLRWPNRVAPAITSAISASNTEASRVSSMLIRTPRSEPGVQCPGQRSPRRAGEPVRAAQCR